jgi:multimeric flavodoxin WrbA
MGNSRFLLEHALAVASSEARAAVESDLYSISGKTIAPCNSCFRCIDLKECSIDDDFQELRDRWLAADAIIYSVPVYHMGLPGQLKSFIDRLGNSTFDSHPGKKLKTVGILAQGGSWFGGQEMVMMFLVMHAVMMGCIPVSGYPYGEYLGAGGWTRGSEKKDRMRHLCEEGDLDAQQTMRAVESVARRVAQVAHVVRAGGIACYEMLKEEGGYQAFLSGIANPESRGGPRGAS